MGIFNWYKNITDFSQLLFLKGPFTQSVSVNTAMTLAILFSLKTMELLENWLQTHSGVTLVFNENRIASIITASTLTLGVNGP